MEERKRYDRYKSRRHTIFHDDGYICCSSYSGKPRLKDFHWRHFKELLKKAVSKLIGHAKELLTMDVYGDNANIILEEIPELLSYINKVIPDKSRDNDNESNMQDIMIDMDTYLPEKKISGEENLN